MSNSPTARYQSPDPDVQDRIHLLWDELSGFEAAQSEEALLHLLRNVAEMVDAQNAYWVGVVRMTEADTDPLYGWRPRVIRYLTTPPDDKSFTRDRMRQAESGPVDELWVAHARSAGSYRADRFRDLVSPDWFDTEEYKTYVGRGVHDSLSVVASVSEVAEGYYGFLRTRPDPFTEAQRDLAYSAIRGLTWFHRQIMLGYGLLVARCPLSPIERRVVALLLTEQSEKSIAAELDVSPASLHTYVRDVVRKFGVSGRKGLIALWLGRQS